MNEVGMGNAQYIHVSFFHSFYRLLGYIFGFVFKLFLGFPWRNIFALTVSYWYLPNHGILWAESFVIFSSEGGPFVSRNNKKGAHAFFSYLEGLSGSQSQDIGSLLMGTRSVAASLEKELKAGLPSVGCQLCLHLVRQKVSVYSKLQTCFLCSGSKGQQKPKTQESCLGVREPHPPVSPTSQLGLYPQGLCDMSNWAVEGCPVCRGQEQSSGCSRERLFAPGTPYSCSWEVRVRRGACWGWG